MYQIDFKIPESWLEYARSDPARLDELRLYRKQDWLEQKRQETRRHYKEKLDQLLQEHEEAQSNIIEEYQEPHADNLKKYGIMETRKRAVPAYTLENFQDLPVELRLRIWSFACRMEEPKINTLCGEDYGVSNTHFPRFSNSPPRNFTNRPEDRRYYDETTVPTVLQICRESRSVAHKVYTRMVLHSHGEERPEAYFNTLYDNFFICGLNGDSWKNYMVLVDLMIQLNSSRPLRQPIQRDVERIQNIRFLSVEFNIFATAPTRVWAEFPKLDQLTIAIFPYDTISDHESRGDGYHRKYEYIRPQRESMYGKRATWLEERAERALEKVKTIELPQWKIPRIEVVIRKTGLGIDHEVDEECTDTAYLDYSMDNRVDDSTWYAQADAKLKQVVTKQQLSFLKQKYHPSRKVSYPDRHPGKEFGDWIEDSETEGGHEHRPYIYEDEY